MRRRSIQSENISTKTNRILNGILVVLILFVIRIWHLGVVQHEEKVEASRKPQKRTIVEKADRAAITDRFGIPLAQNKIQYNIAVSYGGIREVPRNIWEVNEKGKKVKIPKRNIYISELSCLLANELEMNAGRIEDLIHSRAALFGNVPFTIKENISEEKYYKLKMLEKDWPGLVAEKGSRRFYPQGNVGGEAIGYLGAISKAEYEKITSEMQQLRIALTAMEEGDETQLKLRYATLDDVTNRLNVLEGKAYTINDLVGKVGVEKSYDEKLRGFSGVKAYLADPKGNFLQELGTSKPSTEGAHLVLNISAELQEYAEQLLTEYEQAPTPNAPAFLELWSHFPEKHPWIKGGAIVAMDPKTGEVLALASYPRFNPNDFIRGGTPDECAKKSVAVQKWLENEEYIAAIWNQKEQLTRERLDTAKGEFFEEGLYLTWRNYLRMILPSNSPVFSVIEKRDLLEDSAFVQIRVEKLLACFPKLEASKIFDYLYPSKKNVSTLTLIEKDLLENACQTHQEQITSLLEDLSPYFATLSHNADKLLLVDLYRLACDHSRFGPELFSIFEKQTIGEYHACGSALYLVQDALKASLKEAFRENHFRKWRETEFKGYLSCKRKEEEEKKKWARPYIEYLDEAERAQFALFWEKMQWHFLLYLVTGKHFPKEEEFLSYKPLLDSIDPSALRKCIADVSSRVLIAYLKTHRCYEELKRELYGSYRGMRMEQGKFLEKHLAAAFYPKGGFAYSRSHAFRQSATIGSVFKLVPAYVALKQRYLTLEENGQSTQDLNPLTIIDDKRQHGKDWDVGFTLDKKPIPRFYRGGLLPRSDHFGVGQVDVVRALAVSSNPYFALLAGDVLNDPEDLCEAARLFSFGEKTGIDLPGEIKGNIPGDVTYNRTGLYSLSIGQHSLVGTPLQTAVMLSAIANGGKVLKPKVVAIERGERKKTEVKRQIFLPKPVRSTLLKGMQQVVMGDKGTARMVQKQFPASLVERVCGKTSTAEVMEKMSLDAASGRVKVTHVAFSAICFEDTKFENPELVVVVYLRFGEWGRLAAPYALKMIEKWEKMRDEG